MTYSPDEELPLSLLELSSLEDESSEDDEEDESSPELDEEPSDKDESSDDESSDEEEDSAGFFFFLAAALAFPAASSGSLSLCSGSNSPGAKKRGLYCTQDRHYIDINPVIILIVLLLFLTCLYQPTGLGDLQHHLIESLNPSLSWHLAKGYNQCKVPTRSRLMSSTRLDYI